MIYSILRSAIKLMVNIINYRKIRKSLCSCFVLATFVPCLFVVAVISYLTFYQLYIPVLITEMKLHFLIKDDMYRKAVVELDHLKYESLDPRVAYSISLELYLPESPTNMQLGSDGMFMVGLVLSSKASNYSSQEIFKTTMLQYKSSLQQSFETIVYLPFFFFTTNKQMQTLKIDMAEDFVDNYYHKSTEAILTVYNKEVQLYGGSMKINAVFSGVRYLLFYWWMTSAVFGIMALFSSLLLLASFLWLTYFIKRVLREGDGKNSKRARSENIGTDTLEGDYLKQQIKSKNI